MAGYTQAYQQTVLDWAHPTTANGDHIGYSLNGTSENTTVFTARTPVGATNWAAATAATPSVKANAGAITTAAAAAAGTVTHYAIFSALTGGVQKTDWQPLDNSRVIAIGDQAQWAAGQIKVTLD
jgi:hypothetical protein